MHEIVVGILFIIVGIVCTTVFSSDYSLPCIALCFVGIGLVWNGIGKREREKNKPPKDRVDLNAP